MMVARRQNNVTESLRLLRKQKKRDGGLKSQ
jgi:hypothetical protein